MPFKSRSQQKWMFSAQSRGDLPKGTAERWAHHTKNIKKLPEHVKKAFIVSFEKEAAGLASSTLDKAGLLALGAPVAYHTVKAIRKGDTTEAAMGATEGAGLGLLYRAVQKAHK